MCHFLFRYLKCRPALVPKTCDRRLDEACLACSRSSAAGRGDAPDNTGELFFVVIESKNRVRVYRLFGHEREV